MFGFSKYKPTPLIGVDISSSSVKLVQLSRKAEKYYLENFVSEVLPPNSVVEKTIKQVDEVAQAIKRAYSRSGIQIQNAAIAVSGASVITRNIQVNANFTDKELIEQIELEADRYIPYPLEEVYYDFEILGPSSRNPELMEVLLAAARVEVVDARVEALKQAGLKVTMVDVESFAMERSFALIAKHFGFDRQGINVALMDIGSMITTLHVFKDGHSIYTRDHVFGTKQLMDEIERRYGLPPEEARLALKSGTLPEDYTREVLEPFKETVVQQINRSLQIFFSASEETETSYLILAGGGR